MDYLFKEIHVDPKEISGILVTHEHTDHIKGLGVLARKYNLPIYANEKTWAKMEKNIGKIELDQKFLFEANSVKTFGNLYVDYFSVSYKGVAQMFFQFHNE